MEVKSDRGPEPVRPRAAICVACVAAACCALVAAVAWRSGTPSRRPYLVSGPTVTSSNNAVYWVVTVTNPVRRYFWIETGSAQTQPDSQHFLLVPHEQARLCLRVESMEEAARVSVVCRPEARPHGLLQRLERWMEEWGLKRGRSLVFDRRSFTLVGPDDRQ